MRLAFLCIFCFTAFLHGEEKERKSSRFEVGEYVQVDDTVPGNAFLVGTHIAVDGTVDGDLIVIGGDVEINGAVLGNVKVIAGQAVINGTVEGRVDAAAANITMPATGEVKGGVFLLGGYAELRNVVGGNILALTGGLKLGCICRENVRAFVGKLRISSSAEIAGRVKYRSNSEGSISEEALIAGGIEYVPAPLKNLADAPVLSSLALGSKIAAFLMNFCYTFGMGALFLGFFPERMRKVLKVIRKKPIKAALFGLMLTIVLPVLSMILLVSIVGAPFAVMLMALNIFSFYTVKIIPILALANYFFRLLGWQENTIKCLFSGQVFYYAVTSLPVIGWFIALAFALLGLGSTVLSWGKKELAL